MLVLAAVAALLLSVPALIPSSDGAGVSWTFSDGTLMVTGSGPMDDYGSAADVPWAEMSQSVTSVVVGEGITSIGANSFRGMASLASVSIPSSAAGIGDYAFAGCTAVTGLDLPEGVRTIGYGAFKGCTALNTVHVPDTMSDIGGEAFRDTLVKMVIIPAGCAYVTGTYASFDSETSVVRAHTSLPTGLALAVSAALFLGGTLFFVGRGVRRRRGA